MGRPDTRNQYLESVNGELAEWLTKLPGAVERTQCGPEGAEGRTPGVTRTCAMLMQTQLFVSRHNYISGELAEWLKAHPC